MREYYTGNKFGNSFLQLAIVTLLLLYCTNFMTYTGFRSTLQDRIPITICVIIFVICDANYKGCFFDNAIRIMIAGFALSQLSSFILYNQNLYQAFVGILNFLLPILIYYLLIKWKISEKYIYCFLIVFTAAFAFLEILQQYTYPHYWFAGREEAEWSGTLEKRMGMWRFYLYGINYCMLAFVLSIHKFITYKSKKAMYLTLTLIAAVAIYFFLARKNIYSAVSVLIVSLLMWNKQIKTIPKIILAFLFVTGYIVISTNMEELNLQSSKELGEDSEEFIRILAANHFMYDFNSSPLYYIFGAGVPGGNSALSHEIFILADNYNFYQDDCGFIGYFSRFGILGIIIQIYIIGIIIKNRKYIDTGLLLYGIIELEMCFFDFWGNNMRHMAAFAIYIYLIEKSIERNLENSENHYNALKL